jgi:hypothetical protein
MDGKAEIDRRMLIALLVGILVAALVVGILSRSDGDENAAATTTVATSTPVAAVTGVDHHHGNADEQAELQPDVPLDDTTREVVAAQLVGARAFATRYPTVADATKAGYILAGGFAPLLGAHYVGVANAASGAFEAAKASTLIYDGTSPDSRVVGLMYLSAGGAPQAPEGFAGPNDHWHRHTGVCVKFVSGAMEIPFPADADITKAMCDGKGGNFIDRTQWMVHAWVVPAWESPAGVFSHDNPNLLCADGTSNTDKAGFCQGT